MEEENRLIAERKRKLEDIKKILPKYPKSRKIISAYFESIEFILDNIFNSKSLGSSNMNYHRFNFLRTVFTTELLSLNYHIK